MHKLRNMHNFPKFHQPIKAIVLKGQYKIFNNNQGMNFETVLVKTGNEKQNIKFIVTENTVLIMKYITNNIFIES